MTVYISKTPLRLPLGGGGTDIETFWKREEGFWISGAINKFVYVLVKPRFEKQIRVAYSRLEYADKPSEIKHPIIRSVVLLYKMRTNVEIASFSVLPSKIGLGSSGAFTVGLISCVHKYINLDHQTPIDSAEEAYFIEHNILGRAIGKQDPYVSAFGKIRCYTINKKGIVKIGLLEIDGLEEWLSLFYVNRRQTTVTKALKKNTFEILQKIKDMGLLSYDALKNGNGNYHEFGQLIDMHWQLKKKLSLENLKFDSFINYGKKHGAIGGKLVGAGGGGCILFVHSPEKREDLIKAMEKAKLKYIPFGFYDKGSEVKVF